MQTGTRQNAWEMLCYVEIFVALCTTLWKVTEVFVFSHCVGSFCTDQQTAQVFTTHNIEWSDAFH